MKYMKFPGTATMEEYCHCIETFVNQETVAKRRMGFDLHDKNGDGKIDPADLHEM